jgi:outer membrane lipoprotein-sorting protein
MSMKQSFLPILLAFLVAPALAGAASAQTADQIIEKHLAALGGRETLSKLTSRRSTGTITIATPNGDLSGPCEIDVKAPNKSRAYMQLDGSALGLTDKIIIEQKFDGVTGWSLNSMQGDAEVTGNRLENLGNNVFPSPLLNYKAAGVAFEVLPRQQIAGKDALVMRATPKAGSAVLMFFDAETFLLVRTVTKLNDPQMGGEVEQTADLSDYRVVDGVKVPFRIVNSSTTPMGTQTGTITLTKVEHNVTLADALFGGKL